MMHPPRPQRGAHLIELLAAMAIVAILARVVIPNYAKYAQRGKIPEAMSALSIKQIQAEQYWQDNRTYVGSPPCPDPATADSATSAYFSFTCVASATSFTVTATGTRTMPGFAYSIDSAGTRRTVHVPADWRLPASNCWARKADGSC